MLINIRNDISEISRLCDEVKKFCENNGISDNKRSDIALILDEIATNVINYAYPDGGTHTFTLDIRKEGNDKIFIKLSDDGIPFDPLTADDPDTVSPIEQRQNGGLGIFIVKHLSEAISYFRADGKNNLNITVSTINKNIKKEKCNGG